MQLRRLAYCGLLAAGALLALMPGTAAGYQIEDNQVATSFDGTSIVYTLFLPDNASASNPVPAVLRTHGWGGSRETTATGFVQQLLDNGYAVLTWDSRGFGQSGGTVEVDSPDYEARDASALIDVLATDPRIAKMRGDPKVGMSGGSYAGGIQRDDRVRRIAGHEELRARCVAGDDREDGLGQPALWRGAHVGYRRTDGPDRPPDRQLRPGDPPGVRGGQHDGRVLAANAGLLRAPRT